MAGTAKKYSLEDIRVGMMATKESLSNIYDTWIFLVYDRIDDIVGRIAYIGKETTKESDRILRNSKMVTPIYNDSDELNEDIYYEE